MGGVDLLGWKHPPFKAWLLCLLKSLLGSLVMLAALPSDGWVSGTRRSDGWWLPPKDLWGIQTNSCHKNWKSNSKHGNAAPPSLAPVIYDTIPVKVEVTRVVKTVSRVLSVSHGKQRRAGRASEGKRFPAKMKPVWGLGGPGQIRLDVFRERLPSGRAKTWLHCCWGSWIQTMVNKGLEIHIN